MTEFVGIDPEGAKKLVAAMRKARDGLNGDLGDPLRYGLRVAQDDATEDAQASPKRYADYAGLLDKWIKDLSRRIEIITNAPPADLGSDGDQKTAVILTPDEAAAGGTRDGDALKAAWEEFQKSIGMSDYAQARRRFLDALKAAGRNVYDPEYATAFLKSLGADGLTDLIGRFLDLDVTNPYMTEGNFAFFKEALGPLALMVASADKAGTLPEDIRKKILGMNVVELSLFMRMAPQSDQLVLDAMRSILKSAGSVHGDQALANMMPLLKDHPKVLQELLADKRSFEAIFSNSVIVRDRKYFENLAAALEVALSPGAGDPALQQKAWAALIRAGGDKSFRNTVNAHPELARAMAKNFAPYLRWAANKQAQEFGARYQLTIPGLPPGTPALDPSLTVGDVTGFMAVLASDPAALKTLADEGQRLLREGGTFKMITPESIAGGLDDTALQAAVAEDQAVMALLLGGLQRADMDETARRDATADLLKSLVVGYATAPMKLYGPVVDVATGQWTTPASKAFADWIHQKVLDDEQIDSEELYQKFKDVYSETIINHLVSQNERLPEGRRKSPDQLKAMANQIVFQYEAQGLRKMVEEFWKELSGK